MEKTSIEQYKKKLVANDQNIIHELHDRQFSNLDSHFCVSRLLKYLDFRHNATSVDRYKYVFINMENL